MKRFGAGTSAVDTLRGVDVAVDRGSFTAIMGSISGCVGPSAICAQLEAVQEG